MKFIPQILDDMDSEELEMEFYKMDEILQLNRVAIPKEIFDVFDYFSHEYLYCRVFGFNNKKSKEGLVEDFDALDEKIKKEPAKLICQPYISKRHVLLSYLYYTILITKNQKNININ
jgi:hypothetical protein